ncbi:type I-B CRISPR-associated endonuclease Cas1b [Tepidibacillus sp. HK-1]|uniref:type I-B CRISPR-associated endonuclease Cas1b n=1 Tax=Tepidibacillus sp. HK-1 TaxID=1883407 RepID=UPI0008536508|nr:type I-B CRISPR-associated endonuclease Cas1b [Tepidibacillus sp. HK-1]GBF10032.1 CRISPR-associated endonuclease Cas1 [Tepidibacillus sp. HK-1]
MKKDFYIFNNGELKRKDNTLFFESSDEKKYLPVNEINNIWVFGEVDINKRFLEFASEKEIVLHYFNYYGYYIGSFYPREHLNSGYVILKQAEYYLNTEKRMTIAKKFIEGAVLNILVILRYYRNRGIDLNEDIDVISNLYKAINNATDIEILMAIEGNIRERYYKCFDKIINKPDFEFDKRSKRPPLNKLNALISFGNSLIYTTVLGEIYQTQLDPRIGYLHSTNNRRFTLNLDIAEIFKPVIVDRVIFSLLNKNVITSKDFQRQLNGIILNDNGKKKFISEYNDKLNTKINHPKLDNKVSYKRLIRLELYKLQKHITNDDEYSPFIAGW